MGRGKLKTFKGNDHRADGNGGVRHVKNREDTKIDKIDHIAVKNTVVQIADRTGENQGKPDNIPAAEDLIILAEIINVKNQQNERDHGNHDKGNAAVFKNAESKTGIIHKRHVQHVRHNDKRFAGRQRMHKKLFG